MKRKDRGRLGGKSPASEKAHRPPGKKKKKKHMPGEKGQNAKKSQPQKKRKGRNCPELQRKKGRTPGLGKKKTRSEMEKKGTQTAAPERGKSNAGKRGRGHLKEAGHKKNVQIEKAGSSRRGKEGPF